MSHKPAFIAGIAIMISFSWWATAGIAADCALIPKPTAEELLGCISHLVNENRKLEARLINLESRVNGIRLEAVDAGVSPEYGCSSTQRAEPETTVVMYGLRDGTSCKVTNLNYYKRLQVVIPKQ